MPQVRVDPGSWVLAAAHALRQNGSWTGRIHLQKQLFIARSLGLANPPFEFVLHDYGPYSRDLDEEVLELELRGSLDRCYPRPGYGPRYQPTPQGIEEAESLPGGDRKAIGRVARALGSRNSQELELIATCLWVEHEENLTEASQIVARVLTLKPKYNKEAAQSALEDARKMARELAESK